VRRLDSLKLEAAGARLGDVVVDPSIWPDVMQDVCDAAGAAGAGLLQSDSRTPDVPITAAAKDVFSHYFENGWHLRDLRAERSVPLLLSGRNVVVDQDIISRAEIDKSVFYNECMMACGFKWFAAVGFWAGSALWGLSLQRTIAEGPFDKGEQAALGSLSERLTEAATLSTLVGRTSLSAATHALAEVHKAAVAIDKFGIVLDRNAIADSQFDDHVHIRNNRLVINDKTASADLDAIIQQLQTSSDLEVLAKRQFVIQREQRRPILVNVLGIPPAAKIPFSGARAILTFTSLDPLVKPAAEVMVRAFQLTSAESKLASLIATGMSPDVCGEHLGIARATVRNHLKAIFAKTDTHRQSELTALLSKLIS
jgi:DNA-binding CsgD family transcriptional regulator